MALVECVRLGVPPGPPSDCRCVYVLEAEVERDVYVFVSLSKAEAFAEARWPGQQEELVPPYSISKETLIDDRLAEQMIAGEMDIGA